MRWLVAERALWAATLVVGIAAGASWRRARRAMSTPIAPVAIPRTPPRVETIEPESLAAAVDSVRDGNVFRRDRQTAEDAPVPPSVPVAAPPGPPRPPLILRGLLGGPPWDVVIEGIPGRQGSVVVRVGDSVSGLAVRAVRGDTVVIRGRDTTWKLTLRRQ